MLVLISLPRKDGKLSNLRRETIPHKYSNIDSAGRRTGNLVFEKHRYYQLCHSRPSIEETNFNVLSLFRHKIDGTIALMFGLCNHQRTFVWKNINVLTFFDFMLLTFNLTSYLLKHMSRLSLNCQKWNHQNYTPATGNSVLLHIPV